MADEMNNLRYAIGMKA